MFENHGGSCPGLRERVGDAGVGRPVDPWVEILTRVVPPPPPPLTTTTTHPPTATQTPPNTTRGADETTVLQSVEAWYPDTPQAWYVSPAAAVLNPPSPPQLTQTPRLACCSTRQ